MLREPDVGEAGTLQLAQHARLGENPHLQCLALAAVENQIVELLPASVGCHVVQDTPLTSPLDAPVVQFGEVLDGIACLGIGDRKHEHAAGLEQAQRVIEGAADRPRNMLEDVGRDDEVTAPVPMQVRRSNVEARRLVKECIGVTQFPLQPFRVGSSTAHVDADNVLAAGKIG